MAIAQDGALRFDFSGSNMYNPAFINIRVQICVPGADFEFQDPELSIQNCRTAPPRCCRTAPPQQQRERSALAFLHLISVMSSPSSVIPSGINDIQ